MDKKLGKPTDQRLALISNQATDILWYGHIETTFERAKAAAKLVEKVITLAINSYEDVVTEEKTTLDNNGKEKKVTVSKLKNKASGAVFSALVTKDFEMEKVFNPNLEKMKKYETKSSSIFENISSNEKEIAKLQELKQLVISRISGM